MTGTIFEKLTDVERLGLINPKFVADFRDSQDFSKINQIIQQYQTKYRKDLACFNETRQPLGGLKELLARHILTLYEAV
jgi:hypothetical protein